MPIYAYRCESCGHAKDVLQKMSDPLLTDCPACGQPTFKKQVTAAGFQLKGSGWYVTDFRGDGKGGEAAKPADQAAGAAAASGQNGAPNSSSASDKGAAAPAAAAPASAPTAATPAAAPASGSSPAAGGSKPGGAASSQ